MQYNPSFVGYRPILSVEDKAWLYALSAKYPLERFNQDTRSFEEMVVDFVYTSAKIEGNTYDRVDTDNLLRLGVTAGGKRYSDAVMLMNLRDGFGKVIAIERSTPLDLDYLCDLHKVLMKDLLPVHEQGIVRTSAVTIGASRYEPLSDPGRLRSEMKFVLSQANEYPDPFEKAIFLHCNLAYLQYFRDGNKRTARMMQTAVLAQANLLPLFFSDTLIADYQRATVQYYETGDYAPYVAFFKANHQLAISKLISPPLLDPEECIEFERRLSGLSALKTTAGAAQTLWQHAQDALAAHGSPQGVNWPDLERRVIVESIAVNGQSPVEVGAVICKFSPGATSATKQQAILDDIKRIGPELQAQYTNHQHAPGNQP